jgi:hypothetical protein
MLGRIGSAAIAFGLSAALSGALAQERIEPALESQPVPESRDQPGADQSKASAGQEDTDTGRLVAAIDEIKAAIRDLIAEEDPQQRERQEHREEADLHAQQDMALWAKRMFWATFAAVVLTFVGVVLIWRTLIHTRHAAEAAIGGTNAAIDAAKAAQTTAEAAIKANELNRSSFIEMYRARLDLMEMKAVSPLIWRKKDDGTIGELTVRFVVHNTGRTEARGAHIEARLFADQFFMPTRCREEVAASARNRPLRLGQTVVPDGHMRETHTLRVYETELKEYMFQTNRDIWSDIFHCSIHLVGCVDYGLIFDEARRQITFSFSIRALSDDSREGMGIICPALGDVPAERIVFVRFPTLDDFTMD